MSEHENLITAFNDQDPEWEWQRADRHRIEFALTWKALAAHLPPAPAHVLDCGGGSGRHAIELARRGYRVTLFDRSASNLDLARRKAQEAGVELADTIQGNALDLRRFVDEEFDAVLLLGPLYHLLMEEERRQALIECRRVLRSGRPLFASFVCCYAGLRDLAVANPDSIISLTPLIRFVLGEEQVPSSGIGDEYIANPVHPNEVAEQMWQAGLEVRQVIGLEGFLSKIEDGVNQTQGEIFESWVDLNYRISQDPSIWGGVEHLLGVAVRPAWVGVLQQIIRRAREAGLDFNVAGGASIALQGVRLAVKDLDLEMGAADAYQFQNLFPANVVDPVGYKEDIHYRSHFGVFDFEGVQVEVSGDLERREGDSWKPTRNSTRTNVELEGVTVPVSWLEEEFLAYIRRGRIERAAQCLQKCSREKLLRLLRGEEPLGVI